MTPRLPYAPLQAHADPARARAEPWRTALGLLLIGAAYMGGVVALFTALVAVLEPVMGTWAANRFVDAFAAGRTAPGLVLLLYSFGLLALPVVLVTRVLHRRPALGLIGPPRLALSQAIRVALPLLALAVLMMPFAVFSGDAGRRLTAGQWLLWLPVALPGLVVQIMAEELLFRGYLQQQLAARFQSPLVWMALPSALFAWLHFGPGDFGPNAFLVALWAGLFGILAADLTARTGTIGAAVGLHFATNFGAIFLVGLWGQLDALALWNIVVDARDPGAVVPLLAIDLLSLLVSWLLARLVLRV